MKLGDEVEFRGQKGVITWYTPMVMDITFDGMSPIAYEILAQSSMLVAKHYYNSTKDVFTLDRNSPILRDLKLLGNTNDPVVECCCGSKSVGSTRHASYCGMFHPSL